MNYKKYAGWGEFCRVFGITPRNRVLEFFLVGKEIDFSIRDLCEDTGLNRATSYNTVKELLKEGYLMQTRKLSGIQLFKLNPEKEEVKFLVKAFNLVLNNIVREYEEKNRKRIRI